MLNYTEAYKWIKANNDRISDKDAKLTARVMSAPVELKKQLGEAALNLTAGAILALIIPTMAVEKIYEEVKKDFWNSYNEYVRENGTRI